MGTLAALAIVVMGSLLCACGDSSTVSTAPSLSVAPQPAATPGSQVPLGTESQPPAATAPTGAHPEPTSANGITQEEDRLIPPFAPEPPTIEVSPEGLVIRWRGIGPSDLASYLVYHRPTASDPWTILAEVPPVGDNLGSYSYTVAASDQGDAFAVVAVDVDGNRSQFSEAVGVQ
jgi:hypothetical protein